MKKNDTAQARQKMDATKQALENLANQLRQGTEFNEYGRLLTELRRKGDQFINRFGGADNPTEARVIAKLQHPNIVALYEFGQHDGMAYLTLEYISGGSLDRQIRGTTMPA